MGKFVGYARVSTKDQEFDLQMDALKAAGVEDDLIFADIASGAKAERSGLEECIKELQQGDTLIVWRIDRLGKSISHLVKTVEDLRSRGIGFKSICDGAIDTTTASGEVVFNIFSSLAQFERHLIEERVRAGLEAARARGRQGGRKPLSADDARVKAAKEMSENREMTVNEICKTLRISRATYYRFLSVTGQQQSKSATL